ncbi:hypothetical protein ACWCQW_52965 [Streptomyces mirabilis]
MKVMNAHWNVPHSGQLAFLAAWTASVRARVRRSRLQCRERQAYEQNTAADFTEGISGRRTHGTTAARCRRP